MRIDLYGSTTAAEAVDQVSKANAQQAAKAQKQASAAKTSTEDKATLSSGSYSVDSLTKTALQPVPSRAAKVELLKEAVKNAQYVLNSAQIAQSLASSEI